LPISRPMATIPDAVPPAREPFDQNVMVADVLTGCEETAVRGPDRDFLPLGSWRPFQLLRVTIAIPFARHALPQIRVPAIRDGSPKSLSAFRTRSVSAWVALVASPDIQTRSNDHMA